jgi:hypothetical protein
VIVIVYMNVVFVKLIPYELFTQKRFMHLSYYGCE